MGNCKLTQEKVIKLIGIIFIFSITGALGQGIVLDDIKSKARPTLELYDYKITGDTLTLIASTKFLYYPFGIFTNAKDLKKKFANIEYKEEGEISYLIYADNYVKFFYDVDKRKYEIVYARISSPNFALTNGTKTGMTKKELFGKYFFEPVDKMDKIKFLKLESMLTGIWHYYKFDKDILLSFYLDTDYQIDKGL